MKVFRMMLVAAVSVLCAVGHSNVLAASSEPMTLTRSIPMKGISGRIGHLALDTKRNRLFIAISSTNNVEILDLQTNKEMPPLTGLGQPFDVIYLADFDLIAVSSAENGVVYFFNADTLKPDGNVSLGRNATHMRYDAAAKELFVAHGTGTMTAINVAARAPARSFEFEETLNAFCLESTGNRVFLNRSGKKDVLVIDRKTGAILQTWPLEPLDGGGNMTMALDEAHQRLFVGCRKPAKMMVFDTADGRLVKSLGLIGDCDDTHFDSKLNRAYATCGGASGAIDVFEVRSKDDVVLSDRIPTKIGGRSSHLDAATRRLFIMTPADRAGGALLLVFRIHDPAGGATPSKQAATQPSGKR